MPTKHQQTKSNKTFHKSSNFIIKNSGNSSDLTETTNISRQVKVPVTIRCALTGVYPSHHLSHYAYLKHVHFHFAIRNSPIQIVLDLAELYFSKTRGFKLET